MKKLRLAFVFIVMIVAIVGGIYWIVDRGAEENARRISFVNMGYRSSKGLIIKIHSYKGHSIRIKYRIGDVDYVYDGGWDHNPRRLSAGDSIAFKYAIRNPNMVITELEDEY